MLCFNIEYQSDIVRCTKIPISSKVIIYPWCLGAGLFRWWNVTTNKCLGMRTIGAAITILHTGMSITCSNFSLWCVASNGINFGPGAGIAWITAYGRSSSIMVIVIKSPGTPFRWANKGSEVGHCQEVHPLIKNGPVNQNRFVALMSNSRARITIIRSK